MKSSSEAINPWRIGLDWIVLGVGTARLALAANPSIPRIEMRERKVKRGGGRKKAVCDIAAFAFSCPLPFLLFALLCVLCLHV